VISIIALLVGILLPALGAARGSAQAIVCANNARSVAQAMEIAVTNNKNRYPPAYVYPVDNKGSWSFSPNGQDPSKANGYLHWSYALFNSGGVSEDAFSCPTMEFGGHPPTNAAPEDRLDGQTNESGGGVVDKQASRMAFTVNGALISRNRFRQQPGISPARGPNDMHNQLGNPAEVRNPSATVLSTEFFDNWKMIAASGGGNTISKSHRPVIPLSAEGSGYDLNSHYFARRPFSPKKRIGLADDDPHNYGLVENQWYSENPNAKLYGGGMSTANAIGRHHPGGDSKWGGTANFAYADGHVERKNISETLINKEWGDVYTTLEGGDNRILKD